MGPPVNSGQWREFGTPIFFFLIDDRDTDYDELEDDLSISG
jgi:hypothetical protein